MSDSLPLYNKEFFNALAAHLTSLAYNTSVTGGPNTETLAAHNPEGFLLATFHRDLFAGSTVRLHAARFDKALEVVNAAVAFRATWTAVPRRLSLLRDAAVALGWWADIQLDTSARCVGVKITVVESELHDNEPHECSVGVFNEEWKLTSGHMCRHDIHALFEKARQLEQP